MELDFSLFYWLLEHNILKEDNLIYEPLKLIEGSLSQKFTSGFIFSKLLISIESKNSNINLEPSLQNIKDSLNGLEIIENWKKIFQVVEKSFSIFIDEKMKEMVTNGDIFMVSEMFNIFYDKFAKSDSNFIERLNKIQNSQYSSIRLEENSLINKEDEDDDEEVHINDSGDDFDG